MIQSSYSPVPRFTPPRNWLSTQYVWSSVLDMLGVQWEKLRGTQVTVTLVRAVKTTGQNSGSASHVRASGETLAALGLEEWTSGSLAKEMVEGGGRNSRGSPA